MEGIAARFERLFDSTASAGMIVTAREIRAPMPEEELRELEEALEVELSPGLRAFYREVGALSFAWTADQEKLGESDRGYVGGAIQILDALTMIMGRGGRRWDGELYFDHMIEEQKAPFRAFAPFDHTGELAPGFLITGGRVGPEMRLFDANEGIVPFAYDLDGYLARSIETRGFFGWQSWWEDAGGDERERYDRVMPALFGA